jgi:hypothetical protein
MNPVDFLRTVWPDDGFYCIAIKMAHGGWWHTVYSTITEAAEFVEKQGGRDIYFCVHSLKEERVWNPRKRDPKTGEVGAWSIRTQDNMLEARAFFFDLDVGQGDGKYPTAKAAFEDLQRFCDEALLPTPMVVKSGGGLHVYWLLEDSIQTHQWRVYAARLRALAEHYDLIIDPARTTDVASVLRVAGTFNYKTDPPRPVKVLVEGEFTPTEEFIAMLTSSCEVANVTVDAVRPAASSTTMPPHKVVPEHMKGFKGNIDEKPAKEWEPVELIPLTQTCAQAKWLVNNIKGLGYWPWRIGLGLFYYTSDGGAEFCRWWSEQGDFDEGGYQTAMDNLPTGPFRCAQIAEKCGADRCAGCAYQGQDLTPFKATIHATQSAPSPEVEIEVGDETVKVVIPDPPFPYVRLKNGGVGRASDGNIEPIYDHDLFPTAFIVNGDREETQSQWRQVDARGKIDDFLVPVPFLFDKTQFTSTISNRGVIPEQGKVQKVQAYMVAYIKKLQREAEAEAQHNHLGWKADRSQFIMPDRIYCADGSQKPVHLSTNVQRTCVNVGKAGTLEQQIELLKFYNHKDYLPNQFMILAALAAPIFHATGHHGAIVNASGEAGCSKSTTLYTAASFYGHPDRYPINGTNSGATMMARNNYMDTLANLPICVDEITHIPLQDAKNMAMNVSQPNTRVRVDRTGVQRPQLESLKSTIMLTTANSSLHALLSADNSAGTAGSMRIIEVAFKRTNVHTKTQADNYISQLKKNYGHLGPEFIKYVVQHQAEIEERVTEVSAQLDAQCAIAPSERFWSAYCAVIIVAGEIATKLGLLQFNIILLRNWIVEVQLPFMRGVINSQYATPLGILTEFLEQINGQILVTMPGRNGDESDNVVRDVVGMLSARYDTKLQVMWVMKKAFRDYCLKIGANHTTVLNSLNQRVPGQAPNEEPIIPAVSATKMLGARTRHAKAMTPCFTINMSHPEISGAVDRALSTRAMEASVKERPEELPKNVSKFNPFKRGEADQ